MPVPQPRFAWTENILEGLVNYWAVNSSKVDVMDMLVNLYSALHLLVPMLPPWHACWSYILTVELPMQWTVVLCLLDSDAQRSAHQGNAWPLEKYKLCLECLVAALKSGQARKCREWKELARAQTGKIEHFYTISYFSTQLATCLRN